MYKAFKYRLYPTTDQRVLIDKTFGCCRYVYNNALLTSMWTYEATGVHLSAFDLGCQLTEAKEAISWLREVDSQALKAELRHLQDAYKRFFKGKGVGYPRFKSKHGRQSFSCPGNTRRVDFDQQLLTIPKIKDIPIRISRRFEGRIKTVTILRTATGKYFASILVDDGKEPPPKIPTCSARTIGIDVGVKHFATLSDGTKIANPKYLENSLRRLACLQRRYARKQRGSKNRDKARLEVALLYERVANQRQDFLHRLTTAITKQYDTVCVESLNVAGMMKNRSLSRSISDVGWGEFFRQLRYKMDRKGGTVLELPTFYPSSKQCSHCGALTEALTLKDRAWVCPCGARHDRDENAALNIKNYFCSQQPEGIRG